MSSKFWDNEFYQQRSENLLVWSMVSVCVFQDVFQDDFVIKTGCLLESSISMTLLMWIEKFTLIIILTDLFSYSICVSILITTEQRRDIFIDAHVTLLMVMFFRSDCLILSRLCLWSQVKLYIDIILCKIGSYLTSNKGKTNL